MGEEVLCVDCLEVIPGAPRQRRRCDDCRSLRQRQRRKPTRMLRAGEQPPPGEPRRYQLARGYVILSWLTDREYVQVYEHRLIARAEADQHVHHLDLDKSNNDPRNLEVLTPQEHAGRHVRIDMAAAQRLYEEGLGTRRIGEQLGCDPAVVYRALVRAGVPIRRDFTGQRNPNAKLLDQEAATVRRMYFAGVRQVDLAAMFGVSQSGISVIVNRQ